MMFTQCRVRGAEIHFTHGISDEDAAKVLTAISAIEGVDSIAAITIDPGPTILTNLLTSVSDEDIHEQIMDIIKSVRDLP